MRVALVNPPPQKRSGRSDRASVPHLGLGYLAGALRAQGVSVSVLDGKLERVGVSQVIARLRDQAPGLVGLSALTCEIETSADLAQQIKRALPGTPVIVLGAHATALPEQTLDEFPVFDAAIFGEGERTLVEVVRAREAGVPPAGIAGLAWRREGEVVLEAARPWLSAAELEQLPLPAWDLFPHARAYPVLTARGCPAECIVCARPYGAVARVRSAESVLREVAWLLESFAPGYVRMCDETFGIDPRRTAALLDGLIALDVPRRVRWSAHVCASLADEVLMAHMAAAGCDHVRFGIESGNPEILKTVSADVDLQRTAQLVDAAKRAGMATEGVYVIGLPHETRATAWDTIRYAARLNTRHVSISLMAPYPGTAIHEMARRGLGGYRLISGDRRDLSKQLGHALEMEGLSRIEMERLQLIGYVHFFWHNRRFVDFLRFCWRNRVEGWAFLCRFIPRILGLRRGP